MKKIFFGMVTIAVISMTGCDSTTAVSTGELVTFSARLSSTTALPKQTPSATPLAVTDSLQLTRVRILLRDIRFESESDSADFRSLPTVIDLAPTSSLQDIFVGALPPGVFDRIRFKVHRIENDDLINVPPPFRGVFDDFLAGDRYSIIVDGVVYTDGSPTGEIFTYRSRIDEEQRIDLDPALTVSESSPATVTMTLDTGTWFRDQGGMLLDPRVGGNENTIDDNMKSSIDIFEDNDRNGVDD